MITEHLISTVPWDDVGHFVRFSATFEAKGVEAEQQVMETIKQRLAKSPFEF